MKFGASHKFLVLMSIGAAAMLVVIGSGRLRQRALSTSAGPRVDTVVVPPFRVTDAWARPAIQGGTGGAFMTIENISGSAVRIASVSTAAAERAELHETSVHDNMAHMQMRDFIEIAAHQKLILAPGGMHVMMLNLPHALLAGDTIHLIFRVPHSAAADSSALILSVPVRVRVP